MSQRKINFGIIGAGQIAQLCASVFKDNPTMRAVAISDVNHALATQLAAEVGAARVYDDYQSVLADAEVEAVYIATPPFLHRPMVLDAIAAGKHIICEKPFMLNAAEVREIMRAAEEKPHLKIGSCSCRFHDTPSTRRVRQLLQEGHIGELRHVSYELTASHDPLVPMPWAGWKADPRTSGGGIAMDWGVYELDWLSFVLGEQFTPLAFFGVTDSAPLETGYSALISCDDYFIEWRRKREHGPARHVVNFRGTQASLDCAMVPHGEPLHPTLHRYDAESKTLDSQEQDVPPVAWGNTLTYPIQDLANAILAERTSASPPARQLTIHQIIDALYERSAGVVALKS